MQVKKKELKKYVDDMLKQGYDQESIKEHLLNNGYPEEFVSGYFKCNKTKEKSTKVHITKIDDQLTAGERVFILCYSLAVLLFIVWLGLMTESSVLVVFASFLPTIATILIAYIMFQDSKKKFSKIIWLIPLISCMIFIMAAKQGLSPGLEGVKSGNIAVLNLVLSGLFLLLITILPTVRKIELEIPKKAGGKGDYYRSNVGSYYKKEEKKVKAPVSLDVLKNNLELLEKNTKSLNSVIGRVYSFKHGGTAGMRDLIKVNNDWYKEFKELEKHRKVDEHLSDISNLVHNVYNQLRTFLKTESVVFGRDTKDIKLLTRDPRGSSRVLDVLAVNDKATTQKFFETAVELCVKISEEIKALK